MIKISIYNPESYKFDEELVIFEVKKTIKKNLDSGSKPGMTLLENIEISVAVVPHAELVDYARKYFIDETEEELNVHPVLSFPTSEVEGPFVSPPDGVNHIGEIMVSWEKSGMSSKGVADLATHGTLHLLGIHHD